MFEITDKLIEFEAGSKLPVSHASGGIVEFKGIVRNLNEEKEVASLEYEIYDALAIAEGNKIMREALAQFEVGQVYAVHRKGHLQLGDTAVLIQVAAPHRQAAFDACQYIINKIKLRLPIWKKEHYTVGPSEWVKCHHNSPSSH